MLSIQQYIKDNICDPWDGTPFAGYKFLNNKQKGACWRTLCGESNDFFRS